MGRKPWNKRKTWYSKKKRDEKEKEANSAVNSENGRPNNSGWTDRTPIVKENKKFEDYYRAQNIIPEEQFDDFINALRRDLPHSFRLVNYKGESEVLLKILRERYLDKIVDVEVDGQKVEPPEILPWYPNGLGFQMKIPRQVLRRQVVLNGLHNFLVTETELGNVSRQETVSMLPPLLLDVQPHHRVLDMCAAPGSKTAQLIEMLHANDPKPCPSGFVVANDSDNRRCYMLVHQSLKRLQNACCIVVNHDAANMPSIYLSPDKENGEKGELLEFDRVLCDVPCSGDGTARKNLDIWKSWNVNNAYSLHKLQLRIARRGLEMLKIGGRMVYSTCSLNPVEDEAVIMRLLEEAKGTVELVDVSKELPALKRVPGVSRWKTIDRDGITYKTYDDVPAEKKGHLPRSCMVEAEEEETIDEMNMNRSFRILPHHQDTGGFYVAVLQKTAPLPWRRQKGKPDENTLDTKNGAEEEVSKSPERKKAKVSEEDFKKGHKEDPFIFIDSDKEGRWENIAENFKVDKSFPLEQVFYRCEESKSKRNMYLVNDGLKKILQHNFDRIKVINAGLRIFGRVEQKQKHCLYRLVQDGIDVMLSYINGRKIEVCKEDMILMLNSGQNVKVEEFTEAGQKALSQSTSGSVVLWKSTDDGHKVALCVWKGAQSVSAYAEKPVKLHTLRMLGVDTTEQEGEMISNRKKKAQDASGNRPQTEDEQNTSKTENEPSAKSPKTELKTDVSQTETESKNGQTTQESPANPETELKKTNEQPESVEKEAKST